MAVRLQPKTLRPMAEIVNSEDPAHCLNNDIVDSGNATNIKQVMEIVYCRVCHSFISLHSIRMSAPFMNLKNDLGILHSPTPYIVQSFKGLIPFHQFQAHAIFSFQQTMLTRFELFE